LGPARAAVGPKKHLLAVNAVALTKSQAILFQAHEVSEDTLRAFRKLQSDVAEDYLVIFVLDVQGGARLPTELHACAFAFDSRDFQKWGFLTHGKTMLPGHCHFPLLLYFRANPDLQFLWLIEYDVRFTGHWDTFFRRYENDDADFLGCHLRSQTDEPKWNWWFSFAVDPAVKQATPSVQTAQLYRSLLVIARYSRPALQTLTRCFAAGWRGHQEVSVPTVLACHGLRLRDFNGLGINCPARLPVSPAYWSVSDLGGGLSDWGSVRFRPPHMTKPLLKNTLYHPYKPKEMTSSLNLLANVNGKVATAGKLLKALVVRKLRQAVHPIKPSR
jgi:hypothetical protein